MRRVLALRRAVQGQGNAVGEDHFDQLDANGIAEKLMGDTVFSNVMMLGFAWQKGLLPLSEAALMKAIELNGVATKILGFLLRLPVACCSNNYDKHDLLYSLFSIYRLTIFKTSYAIKHFSHVFTAVNVSFDVHRN